MNKPIISSRVKAPGIGKGGHKVRGTAAQRREMYSLFRQETERVREVLVNILLDEDADNGHRIQAGKEILNRGWGAAPQVNVIEEVFRHEVSFNTENLKQMTDAELRAMEGFLARLVAPMDVIEHEATSEQDDPA